MKNCCPIALLFLSGVPITAGAAAAAPDRPLLVSARYYTPISRPWDRSYYHLYRFNPDGSGKTQLTFSRHNDSAACWSPNGRQVAFARRFTSPGLDYSDGDTQICLQASRPGVVPQVILRLHNTYVSGITWSGDGKCLAVETSRMIVFLTPRGAALRQMKTSQDNFLGFAPGGEHYAVTTIDGDTYLVETLSGKKTRVAQPGVWWDSKTFLIWKRLNGKEAEQATSQPMSFVNLKGTVVKSAVLRPTALQRKYFLADQNMILPVWEASRIGPASDLLYIGFGKPREHLFANMRTGEIERWVGQDTGIYSVRFSPDGRWAYSQRGFKDVAPYGKHRDGRERFVQVNTLQVINRRQPTQPRDVISGLVDIKSVDWRR